MVTTNHITLDNTKSHPPSYFEYYFYTSLSVHSSPPPTAQLFSVSHNCLCYKRPLLNELHQYSACVDPYTPLIRQQHILLWSCTCTCVIKLDSVCSRWSPDLVVCVVVEFGYYECVKVCDALLQFGCYQHIKLMKHTTTRQWNIWYRGLHSQKIRQFGGIPVNHQIKTCPKISMSI